MILVSSGMEEGLRSSGFLRAKRARMKASFESVLEGDKV